MLTFIQNKYIAVAMVTFIPIFLVWYPFLLGMETFFFLDIPKPGFGNIIRNWDGPHYMVVAQTLYDQQMITEMLFTDVSTGYYMAHLPFFPLFIRLLKDVFGLLYAGLIVNLIFGYLLNLTFYTMAQKVSKQPVLLTLIFSIFPARFLVVRSIIAPETLLVFCMLVSMFFWEQKRYFLSGVFGLFAVLTKVQALFLFPAYFFDKVEQFFKTREIEWKSLWMGMIPAGLIMLFGFYYLIVGDFFAFLTAQRDNSLYIYFPFSQFNSQNPWSLTPWLEDVVFYIIGMFMLTVAYFKDKKRSWFYFSLFYTLFLIIIPQRDITGFSFPLIPLFLLHFHQFFTSSYMKWALLLSFPAIYFYTINFILSNQADVANWEPFLR